METIIFRGKMPDDVHFFNAKLVKALHEYNVQKEKSDLASSGLVFAPIHEMCEITQEPVCIGMIASGENIIAELELPPRVKAAFTAQRLEVHPDGDHTSIAISRVNRRSKAYFDRYREFLIDKKGVSEKEAADLAKKKREANKKLKNGLSYFWYINSSKKIHTPVYVKATSTKQKRHDTQNTMGMGTTVVHPRVTVKNGNLLLNQ